MQRAMSSVIFIFHALGLGLISRVVYLFYRNVRLLLLFGRISKKNAVFWLLKTTIE